MAYWKVEVISIIVLTVLFNLTYKQYSFKYMMLSTLGLIGFTKKNKNNHQETIENHLSQILPYLQQQDHISLKLTCRIFYYWFVASELWVGMKMEVAQEKMEHYEDFEFEESEPKQISKRDKNIRIHSLKKQSENKMPKREASNIKQKGKAIMSNNELLFRNTEIGFKRLLKTNNSQRTSHLMINTGHQNEDIYMLGDPEEYLIRINEPWSINMKKAQKLTQLIKRLNEFHHKLTIQMKSPCKDMHSLYIRIKQNQQKIKQYYKKTTSQPLHLILQSTEGANQGLLIEEQLNKVSKLFWNNHPSLLAQSQQIQPFLQFCQQQKSKLQKQRHINETSSIGFLESVSSIEQLINAYNSFMEKYPVLGKQSSANLISIYANSLQSYELCNIYFQQNNYLQLRDITWKNLVNHSFFFETLFQIINSICVKLLKLASSYCSDQLTLAVVLTKVRNLKTLSHSIVNVSKYFGKLRKQLEEKKMKAKSELIRQFLSEYEGRDREMLYQTKNPAKLDKWIGELKEKIAMLKTKIQSQ